MRCAIPLCTESPEGAPSSASRTTAPRCTCTAASRPWISDGTPHQWITPADEDHQLARGCQRWAMCRTCRHRTAALGVPDCSGENDGCSTFYWTNQQSARLMFYHDHAWGITRLNVYAGEAAGYLISDPPSRRWSPTGPSPPTRSRWSSRTGPSCRRTIPQRARAALRAGPDLGRHPLGRLTAISGITTSTCRLRIRAIRRA